MIYNMPSADNNQYICYKSERFLLKDNLCYKNTLYEKNYNIQEIVAVDAGLCPSLEKIAKSYTINEIISKIKTIKQNEQLIFIDYINFAPKEIIKHFEFAGYDIIYQTNSLLTSNFLNIVMLGDLEFTKFGLIEDKNKASELIERLKNLDKFDGLKIVSVYRATSIEMKR